MGMNETPSGNRLHVGFFGKRNAGKSSLVNCVTGQDLAVVSEKKGTTTDPVQKAMELLPLGPVVIIDTPGYDDEGELGKLRVQRSRRILNKTDIAVLVVDASLGMDEADWELIRLFQEKKQPYLIVYNKCDLLETQPEAGSREIYVSARKKLGIYELKERIAALIPADTKGRYLVKDLLQPLELAVLVVPIDKAAPKGRLILPQQQTIRDILEAGGISVVVRETELQRTLEKLQRPPSLIITDSQVFETVAQVVPQSVPLTSFSILMARYKGFLETAVRGAAALQSLQDGDRVLISEGCSHHRQCGDIGSEKLPNWLKKYTGKKLEFAWSSGNEFPEELSKYALVIHCGGCMLNEREIQYRMCCAADQEIPFTNYGIAIAAMKGILKRSLSMLPELSEQIREGE